MKINAAAIQTYQQINRQSRPESERPDKASSQVSESPVTIRPQEAGQTSRLAVRAPEGNYSEFLTEEEKQALELLFSRFRDSDRFGPSYAQDAGSGAGRNPVGQLIDVKV